MPRMSDSPSPEPEAIPRVPKVWGEEHWIVNRDYCGKKLVLRKGFRCSLHYHKVKDEVFYVIAGRVLLEYGDGVRVLEVGHHQHIAPGVVHRFWGLKNAKDRWGPDATTCSRACSFGTGDCGDDGSDPKRSHIASCFRVLADRCDWTGNRSGGVSRHFAAIAAHYLACVTDGRGRPGVLPEDAIWYAGMVIGGWQGGCA